MRSECKGCMLVAAGVFLGIGAYALIKNGTAKKAAVKALAKGMELQEKVACAAEKTKEAVADTVAEARLAADEDKGC